MLDFRGLPLSLRVEFVVYDKDEPETEKLLLYLKSHNSAHSVMFCIEMHEIAS